MAHLRDPILSTRRTLLKLGGGAIASVTTGAAFVRDAGAARRGSPFNPILLIPLPVFFLSPDCASIQCADQDEIRHSCNSCKACRSHSINKRWSSESAVVRAHDCCRCTVMKRMVPRVLHQEMFGSGATARTEFDYRSL